MILVCFSDKINISENAATLKSTHPPEMNVIYIVFSEFCKLMHRKALKSVLCGRFSKQCGRAGDRHCVYLEGL